MATCDTSEPSEPIPLADSSCATQANIIKTSFEWTIDCISLRSTSVKEKIVSPVFSAADAHDVEFKWCLKIYLGGDREESKDHISLYLNSCVTRKVVAEYSLSILNPVRIERFKRNCSRMFEKDGGWGCSMFLLRSVLLAQPSELLVDDRLTVYCEVRAIASDNHVTCVGPKKRPKSGLPKDFGTLAEDAEFGDVTLVVGEKEFRAYKGILAARSSVFAAMFQPDLIGPKQDRVIIVDVTEQVFGELLYFIYTSRAPKVNEMACDLLLAAERYALPELKAICGESLAANLSVRTAARALVLADEHQITLLKEKAIKFIEKNARQVWQSVKEDYPDLVEEVYSEINEYCL